MAQSKQNPDDFWDLSALVPRRKSPSTSVSREVETTEIHLPPRPQVNTVTDVPLAERFVSFEEQRRQQCAPKPERVYHPEGALVREVRIYPWKSAYTYYEQFRRHAEHLVTREGKRCPAVDFFSYMPQYTQLNRDQMAYYFWWRTAFRRGEVLPAAYSYLLLYLYELINLDAQHQDPREGQELMLRLWLCYREEHPRLDALLREWLCDYSLLHALPPPKLDPGQYRSLLSGCRLKEFYVSAAGNTDALGTAMLLFCNNYDYTKSKFYTDETKEEYERVLGGAIRVALDFLREERGDALTDLSGVSTVCRDTFAGAVCSWQLKRRIEVDYTSFSHTHDLRYVMTDVLKYAENALRQSRGIKSRLSIYALGIPLRERLNAYLEAALPHRRKAVAEPVIPEYERRYELPTVELSPERAAEIEAGSWQTTKRLIEAFGEETETEENGITPETGVKNAENAPFAVPAPPPVTEQPVVVASVQSAAPESALAAAVGELLPFLPLALAKDRAGQRAFALSRGMLPDAIADRINTAALELLGDILLEEENGCYTVIEDYLEYLSEQGVM
ncbi:MAG: hypothetical protein E7590_03955 [Ruminococcaceae bacterium]|nr:hypothetical protein [Oscillospiraceae bacterium]